MSRSYMKFPATPGDDDLGSLEWDSFRTKERQCILDELRNPESEYGDVVFPIYYGSKGRRGSSKRFNHFKREIRNDYLKEIRDILNGFRERHSWNRREYDDHEEIFTEEFNRIKKMEGRAVKKYLLEWLNTREAKEAVKSWNGKPVDILYYLVNAGIIERAVRLEVKRRLRK